MTGFTDVQRAELEKAWDILTEHFNGVLLAVLAECGDAVEKEAVRVYFKGGRVQAIGLCEEAKDRLLTTEPTT